MKINLDLLRDILLEAEGAENFYDMDYPCAHKFEFKPDSKNQSIYIPYIHHLNYLVNLGFVDLKTNNTMSSISGFFCLTIDGHEFLKVSRMPIIKDEYKAIFSNSILTDLSKRIYQKR